MQDIAVSEFVRRQTPNSRFSHFEGTDAELLDRVQQGFSKAVPGYRPDVLVVPIENVAGFYSGICVLQDGDKLTGTFEQRQPGEAPRKTTSVVGGKKAPAKKAEVVLYSRAAVCEDPTHVSLADWEIVSINCSPVAGDIPINPMTLLHNHFGSPGGTSTGMTDSELVAMLQTAFEWWKDKAFVEVTD